MTRKKSITLALFLIALSAVLAACGGGGSSTTSSGGSAGGSTSEGGGGSSSQGGGDEPTTVRYQTLAGFISPLEVANKLGYLGNVKIESVGSVAGGPEAIQAVATGQADVAGAPFNGAIIKAISAGAPIEAVLGVSGSNEEAFEGLYTTEDSPIKTAKDLVGKSVGVNTLGATEEAWVDIWLKQEGLSPEEVDQVEFVVIPSLNAEQAMRQGQLDSVVLLGQLREVAETKGAIRTIAKDTDALGNYTANSAAMKTNFIEEHPQTTKEVVAGMAKAVKYLQTEPRAKVVKLAEEVAAENGRPEENESLEFWKSQGVANPGGVIDSDEFSTWIKWLEENGELEPGQVKLAETYTNEFNPFANGGGDG